MFSTVPQNSPMFSSLDYSYLGCCTDHAVAYVQEDEESNTFQRRTLKPNKPGAS